MGKQCTEYPGPIEGVRFLLSPLKTSVNLSPWLETRLDILLIAHLSRDVFFRSILAYGDSRFSKEQAAHRDANSVTPGVGKIRVSKNIGQLSRHSRRWGQSATSSFHPVNGVIQFPIDRRQIDQTVEKKTRRESYSQVRMVCITP